MNKYLNQKKNKERDLVDKEFKKQDPVRWAEVQRRRARNKKYKPSPKPLIEVTWRRMTPNKPPKGCGIYAIRHGQRWLYIGKSQSIRERVLTPRHPMQITKGLDTLKLSYWYCLLPVELIHRAECQQIKQHEPEWNGGTEWSCYHVVHGPTCQWNPPLTSASMAALWDELA